MLDLVQLVYTSQATRTMNMQDFVDLLTKSRDNNRRLNITGMLLHQKGQFLQVIEGERVAVENLFRKIVSDPRHRDITLLVKYPIQTREYSDWDMKFTDIDRIELKNIPEFAAFAKRDFSLRNFAFNDFSYTLLSVFREV